MKKNSIIKEFHIKLLCKRNPDFNLIQSIDRTSLVPSSKRMRIRMFQIKSSLAQLRYPSRDLEILKDSPRQI